MRITRYKYPRTYHVPFSLGKSNDDKTLDNLDHFIGKEIVITEKMDGECVQSLTKIRMIDDTVLSIGNIVKNNLVGKYVWGVDQNNNVVPSKITRTYFNGNTTDWIRIKIKGNHSTYQSLICTPNHRLITPNGEVEVKDIKINDICYTIDNDVKLTDIQIQVLLGKLLGDGSFHPRKQKTKQSWDSKKANIQFSHKQTHAEYVEWTQHWLGNISNNSCVDSFPRYGNTVMIKSWTINTYSIYSQFSGMIVNDTKIVPNWVVDIATPLTLAFWYMDDGNLTHSSAQQDRMNISVCGFDEDSCKVLQSLLMKFNISSTLCTLTGYRYLYLNFENTNKLAKLIVPYVHDSMKYKLPECYRTTLCIAPPNNKPVVSYKFLREVSVISIEHNYQSRYSGKYDIETETHNYIANGTLIHNCTTLYPDYFLHARSLDSANHPSRDWVKSFHAEKAHHIPKNYRICGENLYAKHSIEYKELESYFYVFSIWDDWNEENWCLDWDSTKTFCNNYGLNIVPELWRGTFDEKVVRAYASGIDMIQCEGFVIRVIDGFWYEDFNKSVAKYVRASHVQSDEHWMHQQIVPNQLKQK